MLTPRPGRGRRRAQSAPKRQFRAMRRNRNKRAAWPPFFLSLMKRCLAVVAVIADRWAVERHIGIIVTRNWIGKIVAAAMRQRLQVPIALDELQDRDVIGVGVADVTATGERRDDDERNARPVAEEVERLNIAGVIVTAAFVEGNDECSVGEEFGPGHKVVNGLLDHSFQEVELRGSRVAVEQAVGLDEGYRRQCFGVDGGEEIGRILDVSGALRRVTHDGVGVGLEVADVAVGLANQDGRIGSSSTRLQDLCELYSGVICSAVVGPGNALFVECFADRARIDWRDGAALGYSGLVNGAVWEKSGRV